MAVVNSLVFDDHSGAIVTDEEYWFLRRRKSFFADNLHELVPPGAAAELGVEVVYGGVGHPSFHYEVAGKVRSEVESRVAAWREKGGAPPFATVEDVGRLVVEVTQKTVHRRRDEKLRFFYGFTADDWLRGSFEKDGKKVEIKQAKVRERAKGIVEYGEKSPMMKAVYDNVAVLLGHDGVRGMGNYHLKAENCVLSLVSGRFEAVGKGKYASAMVLTHYLGNKTLDERRRGLSFPEGLVELLSATLEAQEYFQEAGGGLNLVLVDGRAPKPADRLRTVSAPPMKLAQEAVAALRAGLLPRRKAEALVEDLVRGGDVDKAEEALFRAARDPKALELLLRGYKVQDWMTEGYGLPAVEKAQKKSTKATKG